MKEHQAVQLSDESLKLIEQYKLKHSQECYGVSADREATVESTEKWIKDGKVIIPDQNERPILSVLDYGCGQSKLCRETLPFRHPHVKFFAWDPATESDALPVGPCDLTLCYDVMEHIPEHDVDRVVLDIMSRTGPGGVAIFRVCTRPAVAKMPDGGDPHVTVRPGEWWLDRIRNVCSGIADKSDVYEEPGPRNDEIVVVARHGYPF